MSSAEALLPLNWLVAAARLTVSAAVPSALRVVGPNFNISSQNTTRMPLAAVENGTKPTLTASVIGESSRNQGKRRVGKRPDEASNPVFDGGWLRQAHGLSRTMARQPRRCQARRGRAVTSGE